MNYNILSVNGSKLNIPQNQIEVSNNPTDYYPDKIIGDYCIDFETDVETEIANRVNYSGEGLDVAVQNLFVRAVRHHELKKLDINLGIFLVLVVGLLTTRLNSSFTFLERLLGFFLGNIIHILAELLLTRTIVKGSELLGINPGFSI
ncbi:MAG: hypothetical protein C5B43_02540 [Verrucomicrobia bacterium]|nr:MAG: hypothetical protein C5B43_02540 [Verrucomicrobiota bacterium]